VSTNQNAGGTNQWIKIANMYQKTLNEPYVELGKDENLAIEFLRDHGVFGSNDIVLPAGEYNGIPDIHAEERAMYYSQANNITPRSIVVVPDPCGECQTLASVLKKSLGWDFSLVGLP